MKFERVGNPDYGQLTVSLGPGEKFIGEGGAMAWMDEGMEVNSRMMGGFLKSVFRRVVAGESAFVGEYSHPTGGSVTFSPATPGTIIHRELNGDSIILTASSFMACTTGIDLKTRFGGLKAFLSGEGAFFIECSGNGDLFFNAYGAIVEKQINGSFIVDTSHAVAWEPSLNYTIQGMGSLKSTLFSGEGLVMRFEGSGKIYLQTRSLNGISGWITKYLRV